jgi:hypothetical protein
VAPARRARQQRAGRGGLHAALPRLSLGPCRVRRRALPDAAPLLRQRPHRLHLRVGDEWNGATIGADGRPRPRTPRHFRSLSQAEEENGQSRIYLGIHWSFDKTEGIAQGRRIADYVFESALRPLRERERERDGRRR